MSRVDVSSRETLSELVWREVEPVPDSATLLVPARTPLFDELTRVECLVFPELCNMFDSEPTAFWIVVGPTGVRHAMRLAFPRIENGLSAPFLIHDLVRSDQVSAGEIDAALTKADAPPSKAFSVESSFRVEAANNVSAALPAYLGLTRWGLATGRWGAFAHQNRAAKKSFARAGMASEPLLPDRELYTPSPKPGHPPDIRYQPSLVRGDRQLLHRWREIVPEHLGDRIDIRDAEIDLRDSADHQFTESARNQ